MRMKKLLKLLSLLVLPILLISTTKIAAQQTARSFDGTDPYANYYLEHLPDDYNPNDGKRYPVLIALHGFGEGGNPSIHSTKFLLGTGIPALIDNGSFPSSVTVNGQVFKFIVISPQLNRKNLVWYTPEVDYVVKQVKSIYANKADFQRIYLTGYSGGGAGVYTYPATSAAFGNQIAAAVICSGAAWFQNYTEISNIVSSNLPIWAFHNDGDPIVSPTSDQGWYWALNAAGMNPQMKLTMYQNQNQHDSWTRTYDPSPSNPNNIYQWLLQYSRPNIANPGGSAPPPNSVPTAYAGNDQTLTLPVNSTILDGGGSSDAGGSITSYQWGKLSGPGGDQINNPSQARTGISVNAAGTYVYQLQVKDNQGNTSYSRLNIQVNPAPAPASAPTAVAGNDQTLTLPAGSTTLDGSNSGDAGGSITSYQWGKLSGPGGDQINNPNQARTGITLNSAGTYIYQLLVKDNQGNTSNSRLTIKVNPAPAPPPSASVPQAIAGSDQAITLPVNSFVLDGSASKDAGGTITSYLWGKLAGPAGDILSNYTQPRINVTVTSPGTYIYQLYITDNQGNSSASRLTILVNPANQPAPSTPQAIAGNDQQITLPSNSFTLDGTASRDAGGSISTYQWGKLAGPAGDQIYNSNQASTMVNVVNPGVYTYQLYITDNQGHTSASRMNVTVGAAQPSAGPPQPNQQSSLKAVAGSEVAVILPAGTTLDASNSVAKNGNIISYQWTKIAGPSGDYLSSNNQVLTNANYNQPGHYDYTLTVCDDQGNVSSCLKTVIVYPQGTPTSTPVANAGNNQSVTTSDHAILDGSQSTDQYARIIHVSWTKISGPAGDAIGGNSHLTGDVSFTYPGNYVYQLYIGDSQGNSATSTLQISVSPSFNQQSKSAFLNSRSPSLSLTTMHSSGHVGEGLSVYPNPVINSTHLELNSSVTGTLNILVYDLKGTIIRKLQVLKSSILFASDIDLSSLDKGIYILEVNLNNYKKSLKILKY